MPWAYIREGLLSEGYLRLTFGGLIFGRAYFRKGLFLGGLIIGILRYILMSWLNGACDLLSGCKWEVVARGKWSLGES